MKRRVALIALSLVAGAGAAPAMWSQEGPVQDTTPALPINPKDICSYCTYGGKVYSNGAQICVLPGNMTLECE